MAVSISTGTSHGLKPMEANPLGGVRSKYPGPGLEYLGTATSPGGGGFCPSLHRTD